jgi:hypothetical protein
MRCFLLHFPYYTAKHSYSFGTSRSRQGFDDGKQGIRAVMSEINLVVPDYIYRPFVSVIAIASSPAG